MATGQVGKLPACWIGRCLAFRPEDVEKAGR